MVNDVWREQKEEVKRIIANSTHRFACRRGCTTTLEEEAFVFSLSLAEAAAALRNNKKKNHGER
jgi:hypothetical protein